MQTPSTNDIATAEANKLALTRHALRSASGKFITRTCGACGSRATRLYADGSEKWCECSKCGHSTDLTNVR